MNKEGTGFPYVIGLRAAHGEQVEQVEARIRLDVPYSRFPARVLERLGYVADATRQMRRPDGSITEVLVGDVYTRVRNEVLPVLSIFGDDEDAILGRLTLATFCLEADPETETLTPTMAR